LDYPESVHAAGSTFYLVKVDVDNGLYTVADRLRVALFDASAIEEEGQTLEQSASGKELSAEAEVIAKKEQFDIWRGPLPEQYNSRTGAVLNGAQNYEDLSRWVEVLEKQKLNSHQVIAATPDFGTATLLTVRDTFKQPIYIALYTIFVLAACFHAFNGFWTFLISWGWVLKMAAQRAWVGVSVVLMLVMMFFGLAAIWGTYWFNLRF
jgi:succinate dehydrogenase / fumarate reductase cytochrome b subunit